MSSATHPRLVAVAVRPHLHKVAATPTHHPQLHGSKQSGGGTPHKQIFLRECVGVSPCPQKAIVGKSPPSSEPFSFQQQYPVPTGAAPRRKTAFALCTKRKIYGFSSSLDNLSSHASGFPKSTAPVPAAETDFRSPAACSSQPLGGLSQSDYKQVNHDTPFNSKQCLVLATYDSHSCSTRCSALCLMDLPSDADRSGHGSKDMPDGGSPHSDGFEVEERITSPSVTSRTRVTIRTCLSRILPRRCD